MKGKFLLTSLLLLPVCPAIMVAQATSPTTATSTTAADAPEALQRYEAFAAAAYSSVNQVKGSSALIGVDIGGSAKLNKWFGGTADFSDFQTSATSNGYAKPNMTSLLAGPEFSVKSDNLTGFLHVEFGGVHTGYAGTHPDVSFAYAVGGGFEYVIHGHWSARVSGDGVLSSFVYDPENTGASPHRRTNPRATGGISYHF